MKQLLLLSLIPAMAILGSCAINQSIRPVSVPHDATICIIEDTAVREGFLIELKKVLDEKRVRYKVVDKHEALDCEWTMTYLGRWSWDLTIYMAYAEMRIFQNGAQRGQAVYDASGGGFNFNKFIDAEPKIRELVEELLR
jgi:hypothetical protein